MSEANQDNVKRAMERARSATYVSDEAFKIAETMLFGFFAATIMSILMEDKTGSSDLIARVTVNAAKAIDELVDDEIDEALSEDDDDDGMNGAPVPPSNPIRPKLWGDLYSIPMQGCDCTMCEDARKKLDDAKKKWDDADKQKKEEASTTEATYRFLDRPIYPARPLFFD